MAEDAIFPGAPPHDPERSPPGAKRALRARLRALRQALPAADRMRAAEAIVAPILAFPELQARAYIAGYWAMDGEVPLHVLQLRLPAHATWCLPCIQDDGSLRFAPWRPGDPLVSNRYGIPEPDFAPTSLLEARAMAVMLLPLVGFSRDGGRLGMGGGYYDRTLAFRAADPAPPPRLVGVGYALQETARWPQDAWDVRLDAIVTERECINVAAGASCPPSASPPTSPLPGGGAPP